MSGWQVFLNLKPLKNTKIANRIPKIKKRKIIKMKLKYSRAPTGSFFLAFTPGTVKVIEIIGTGTKFGVGAWAGLWVSGTEPFQIIFGCSRPESERSARERERTERHTDRPFSVPHPAPFSKGWKYS